MSMYLSQSSSGIVIVPGFPDPFILPIPDLNVQVDGTLDMAARFIVDPGNRRTATAMNGLSTFASYDPSTELLTGLVLGLETGVTLEVTF